MGTTRPRESARDLPHSAVAGARSLRFVVNPLVTHVRRNHQGAMPFMVERFKQHRVSAIGEQHECFFGAGMGENGCVRMFIRELCLALHRDADAHFRYFVVEFDEDEMLRSMGDWRTMAMPAGTVNPKAYWFASYMQNSLALKEVFLAIAREIPEAELEVVGIDRRAGVLGMDAGLPGGSEDDLRALHAASEEREATAVRLFVERVLSRLGSDRALLYFGADHMREGTPADDGGMGFNENTLVRRLISEGHLSADDVYAVATVYPGTMRTRGMGRFGAAGASGGFHPRRYEAEPNENTVRIFDVLRAEFPDDHNLGFDVDDARFAILPLDRNTAYSLGEQWDGCLYFRDWNRWDGTTDPPATSIVTRDAYPPVTITSVIPTWAGVGATIFVYGFVLSEPIQVDVVRRGYDRESATWVEQRFPCTEVRVINENVLSARVPEPGGYPVHGQTADLEVRKSYADPIYDQTVQVPYAFRYTL